MRKQFEKEGRIIDNNWDHYDYRHTVIQPKRMSPQELQDGADWLYVQYYRIDRIIVRTLKELLKTGLYAAILTWRLNMTYRYDNRCLKLKGRNPAKIRSGISLRPHENVV
ncbi:MAG: hypothetical protein GXP53_08335 [Deltaproteobacteria bacterium]|nr:hypothetical protein [Deltaproteobacteria bacterium]